MENMYTPPESGEITKDTGNKFSLIKYLLWLAGLAGFIFGFALIIIEIINIVKYMPEFISYIDPSLGHKMGVALPAQLLRVVTLILGIWVCKRSFRLLRGKRWSVVVNGKRKYFFTLKHGSLVIFGIPLLVAGLVMIILILKTV